MTLAQLLNRPCVIVRRSDTGDEDDYGNVVATEATVEAVFELQQHQRSELEGQGEVSDTGWLGVFPVGTQLDSDDYVVDVETGQSFELIGQPWTARNPRTQAASHVEAELQRMAGAEDGS